MLSEEKLIESYRTHARELLIFLNRLTGSPETSEDLLHDCFANLIDYSKKHDIINIRAFLYRTAHNIALNYIRKNSRVIYSETQNYGKSRDNDEISVSIEMNELNRRIYELLDTLDELTRSLFILRKENGLSLEQIAATTGRSERTVRRKLKAATDYIYSTLKKEGLIGNE